LLVRVRTFDGTTSEGTTHIATACRAQHAVASTHRWNGPNALGIDLCGKSHAARTRSFLFAGVRACALALARACAVIEQVDARHGAGSGDGRSKTWRGACRLR
jgi:hypothetical protein